MSCRVVYVQPHRSWNPALNECAPETYDKRGLGDIASGGGSCSDC